MLAVNKICIFLCNAQKKIKAKHQQKQQRKIDFAKQDYLKRIAQKLSDSTNTLQHLNAYEGALPNTVTFLLILLTKCQLYDP